MPVPSRVRIAVLLLFATAFRPLHATDLTSSEVGYKLSRADNPFVVVPGAIIDTRGNGAVAIDASGSSGWALTNNGTVYGGYNAVHLPLGTLTNFGVLASPGTTAVAMFAGGTVVNHAGAVIAGKLDGIYLGQSGSIVINAGDIAGDVFDYSSTQAAIHFAESGTVVNLATGRIVGHAHGILATPALTLDNAGLIASDEGAAIDLHSGPSAPASIVNSGTINGRSGVAIAFGPADDRLEITGTSRITGVVDGGAAGSAGNMLVLGGADAGSFDLSALGPAAQYRNFGILQKQGASIWTLTGANLDEQAWQVGGGGFVVAGQLTGSLTAQPGVTGLYIEVAPGGALQSPTTSAITLNGGSQIVNAGTITASGAGVPAIRIGGADGPASVVNQPGATIAGSQGPAIVADANVAIVNAGTLSGSGVAVQFTGANSTLTLDTGSALSGDLDGGNGAGNALILQGSGSLPGRAYNFPNFYMRGTDWLLDGTAEIGTSATVETGTLRVNGTLASPAVAVSPGAALAGTGTVQGAVSVQGIVAPGNTVLPTTPRAPLSVGTLSVVGSYSQAAGAVYQVDVSPTSNDLIDVTGPAALAGGMVQARLRALSLRPADTYRILSASGGLTGTFAGVTTLNPFATPSLAYDAGNAYLVVARGFALAGGTPNEIAVETALDRDAFAAGTNNAPSRDFLSVAVELFNQEGAGAYAAIDQLSAEAYAALPNAHYAAARAGMNAIDTRLADNTCTGAAPAARFCAWATVLGNTGRIGGYDTWLSQDINLAGVMAGVDYQWTPAFTGGMAFGYLHGNTFTHGLPVHGQFDSYQAVLYGRYTAGRFWFRQALGYARNIDDMRRDITFTEVPRTATGGAHGNQFFTALRTGVDLPLALPGVLSPFAGAELQSVKLSGTVESGADSVNLVLPSRTTHSVRSLLGTEWRHLFDGPGGAWRIDAAAAWVHTFGTNTLAINARYAGAPATDFTVHGSGQNRNAAQLRLGMSVSPTPRSRLSIRYDGELGTHGSTHGGAVGFSYHW
jgi:uncharacterized protein with beta-barrel porin domain